MSLWVGLETSSRAASIAVSVTRTPDGEGAGAGEIVSRSLEAQRAHASDLLPTLDEMLAEHGRSPREIDGLVIGTGPGSYTGLRVGIATALGLARAVEAQLVALPSLEALAFGELARGEEGLLVSNAHAGALYVAQYRRTGSGVETVAAPAVAPAAEVRPVVEQTSGRIFADEAAAEQLELREIAAQRLTVGVVPRAEALLELGLQRFARDGASDPGEIEPLYLRAFRAKVRKR